MSPGNERDLIKLLKELCHDVKVLKENSKTIGDAVLVLSKIPKEDLKRMAEIKNEKEGEWVRKIYFKGNMEVGTPEYASVYNCPFCNFRSIHIYDYCANCGARLTEPKEVIDD